MKKFRMAYRRRSGIVIEVIIQAVFGAMVLYAAVVVLSLIFGS
jgi:hypothetical protein